LRSAIATPLPNQQTIPKIPKIRHPDAGLGPFAEKAGWAAVQHPESPGDPEQAEGKNAASKVFKSIQENWGGFLHDARLQLSPRHHSTTNGDCGSEQESHPWHVAAKVLIASQPASSAIPAWVFRVSTQKSHSPRGSFFLHM
jgi:hypothetical protein